MNFVFKSAKQILFESFLLGKKLYDMNIRPNHAISLWRGGTIVGIGINEYFRLQGVFINHTAITTSTYGENFTQKEVIVKGLEHVIKVVVPEDVLLIIDDIYDTGETISHLLSLLQHQTRKNMPHKVYVATLDRKPEKNLYNTNLIYLNDYDKDCWVNYPHEISDLLIDNQESILKDNNPNIFEILSKKSFPIENLNIEDDYLWLTPEKIQI
ncbi:MAG: phosphoribosyltransferase, partial [Spirochaetota bacterium]